MDFYFFKTAIKNLKTVGALFPSSNVILDSIIKLIPDNAKKIVEYGPGNGALLLKLLEKIKSYDDAIIYAIEVNKDFFNQLSNIKNHQLKLIEGDVLEILKSKPFTQEVDVIISSIPLSLISKDTLTFLIKASKDALKKGGKLIIYNYSPRTYPVLKSYFSEVKIKIEFLYFPPVFILIAENS